MKPQKPRRSLRRKIQNAIFRSTFISHLMLACVLLPAIFALLIPVGQIMTRGVAIEIVQRYTMSDMNKTLKAQINSSTINSMTEEALIKKAVEANQLKDLSSLTQEKLLMLDENFFNIPTLQVDPKSSDIKRLILVSSEQYQNSNQFFDKQLPFLKIYTLDFYVYGYDFFLPDASVKPKLGQENFLESLLMDTEVTVTVTNLENIPIGHLTVGLNPNIINLIVVPYIVLVLSISFASLLVVSLLGKFMTAGILRPINSINSQLKAMAEGDLENIACTPIVLKKAPYEVTQIIDSANLILVKMMDNKHLLESQNDELHMQNEELMETKNIIQKQQNMLVQTEKMASVGQLSAAIVHEINTPVGAIKSNAQMIQMLSDQMAKHSLTPEQEKPLKKIKELNDIILQASDRVSGIIKSLKSYSRLDQSDFKASNINEDLQNVLLLTSNLWKNRIQTVERYGDIPYVKCFSGLLNQVFMNLVVNAIDAMEDGGTLTLTTAQRDEYVYVAIQDTGTGIQSDHLSQIFDEGFTTKSKNKGSGLGLALSKAVVEKHNGWIEVETELGVGSTFTVFLPLNSDKT